MWLFASLLDAVLDNASMVRWDMAVAAAIHARVTPAGLTFFRWVTRIGSPVTMSWLAIVGGVWLIVQRRFELVVTWIAVFVGGALIERMFKAVVHRTRPEYAATDLHLVSFSFPSGHATLSFLGMAMLIYTLIVTGHLRTKRARVATIAAAAVFVLLVGISRVYLGVHYPSDVLGGYAVAAAWFSGCVSLAGVVLHHRGRSMSSGGQVSESTL